MEWDAMQRPLQPPPGYEHYHTREAVFPGFRRKLKRMNTWADVSQSLVDGWRLYRHYYIPDPAMEKWEREEKLTDEARKGRRLYKEMKRGEQALMRGIARVEKVAEEVADEADRQRPAAQRWMQDRVGVLKESLSEFGEGYREVVSGERTFWGEERYEEHLVSQENRPVVYRVDKEVD